MEPGEALSTAAQIALALAGFAGVVVAFRSSSLHEWSLLDKYRLRLLLGSALVPFFSCLFGMLLLKVTALHDRRLIRSLSAFSLAKEDQVNENA
jgi:drug/metabolite transporter (DMT)-like permease